jgi:hypothetical protein
MLRAPQWRPSGSGEVFTTNNAIVLAADTLVNNFALSERTTITTKYHPYRRRLRGGALALRIDVRVLDRVTFSTYLDTEHLERPA